jgi:hypothetical protein
MDAQGSTLISQTIYTVVIIVFLVGSFLFVRLYLRSKSSTSVLILLCTVTLGIGIFGVMWQLRFSDIVAWTGRLGWSAGNLHYLIALRNAPKETNSQ